MQGDILPFGLCRNPVWRDSSNVKRERAVRDGYGIEGMGSDSGILLGIILNFSHFLSVFLCVRKMLLDFPESLSPFVRATEYRFGYCVRIELGRAFL